MAHPIKEILVLIRDVNMGCNPDLQRMLFNLTQEVFSMSESLTHLQEQFTALEQNVAAAQAKVEAANAKADILIAGNKALNEQVAGLLAQVSTLQAAGAATVSDGDLDALATRAASLNAVIVDTNAALEAQIAEDDEATK